MKAHYRQSGRIGTYHRIEAIWWIGNYWILSSSLEVIRMMVDGDYWYRRIVQYDQMESLYWSLYWSLY